MQTEYRIIATMTFRGAAAEADRDEWYDAIKTAVVSAKPSKPIFHQGHMTKDDYSVPGRETEAI